MGMYPKARPCKSPEAKRAQCLGAAERGEGFWAGVAEVRELGWTA